MIRCADIHKSYGSLAVLKGVSLEIGKGELVCIVGPSGAGKSTLLHILGTLDKPDKGVVEINEIKIAGLKDNELSDFRNKHLGFVFQFHHLLPEFTALENVCMPAWIAKQKESEIQKRAKELLDFMGLKDRLQHKPNELSGGEQQRVSVARALMNKPFVVLADEPTGNLDSERSEELHQLFFRLKKDFNQTFIIVTHNEGLAEKADKKFSMKDGLIVSQNEFAGNINYYADKLLLDFAINEAFSILNESDNDMWPFIVSDMGGAKYVHRLMVENPEDIIKVAEYKIKSLNGEAEHALIVSDGYTTINGNKYHSILIRFFDNHSSEGRIYSQRYTKKNISNDVILIGDVEQIDIEPNILL